MTPRIKSRQESPVEVDSLIVLRWRCDNDPRLSKLIAHYKVNPDFRLAVICMSEKGACERESTGSLKHFSLKLCGESRLGVRLMKLWSASRGLRRMVRPTFLHGINLDGYLVSKVAFPFRKVAFDQFDSWGTMSGSFTWKAIEVLAIALSSFFVAATSLASPKWKKNKILFLNLVTEFVMPESLGSRKSPAATELEFDYLLAGGSFQASRLDQLALAASEFSKLKIVIAGASDEQLRPHPNLVHLGQVTWAEWLHLASRCSAIWAWYDSDSEHYSGGISPNKYWEACWFGKPLVVNRIEAFTDRATFEPAILQLGASLADLRLLSERIEVFVQECSKPTLAHSIKELLELENKRALDFSKFVQFMTQRNKFGGAFALSKRNFTHQD